MHTLSVTRNHAAISDHSDDDISRGNAFANDENLATQKKRHLQGTQSDDDEEQSHDDSTSSPALKKMRKTSPITNITPQLELRSEFTTVAGQMKLNPDFTEEEAKVAAKKEYNRRNAARSRARKKHAVAGLHQKFDILEKRAEELSRENDLLRSRIELLQETRRQEQVTSGLAATAPVPGLSLLSGGAGLPLTSELVQALSGGSSSPSASALLQARNLLRQHALTSALNGYPAAAGFRSSVAELPLATAAVSDMSFGRKHLEYLRRTVLGQLPPPSTSSVPLSTTGL